ncbi:MAG: OmpA family protein [Planctomycetota bacterium]
MSLYHVFSKIAMAAGAILLVTGCNDRQKVANAAKDETIRKQEQRLAEAKAENEKAAQLNADIAKQNEMLITDSATAAQKQASETAAMRPEIAALHAAMNNISSEMVKLKPKEGLAEGQKVGYDQRGDGTIHITVAGTALFDSGQAELKKSAHEMLMKVAQAIKKDFPKNFIRVEGHTDSTPVVHAKAKFKDNMELSIARSRAVYDFLVKEGGIASSKMYTAGYGEHQPLAHPEKTAADRSKNRRVEIVIMPLDVKIKKDQLKK